MDDYTKQHLMSWVQRHVPEEDRFHVWDRIITFVNEHPDLLGARSWPEIRDLAMQGCGVVKQYKGRTNEQT